MDGPCLRCFSPRPRILSKASTESTSNTFLPLFILNTELRPIFGIGRESQILTVWGVFSLAKDRMERNSLMQIAKFLRYNSPSKRQIRRMVGRPKAPNAKELAAQAAAREPLLYTKKEDAPFAVRAFLFSPLIQ